MSSQIPAPRPPAEVVEAVVQLLLTSDEFGAQFDELIDRGASDPYRIERPGDLAVEQFVHDVTQAVS